MNACYQKVRALGFKQRPDEVIIVVQWRHESGSIIFYTTVSPTSQMSIGFSDSRRHWVVPALIPIA